MKFTNAEMKSRVRGSKPFHGIDSQKPSRSKRNGPGISCWNSSVRWMYAACVQEMWQNFMPIKFIFLIFDYKVGSTNSLHLIQMHKRNIIELQRYQYHDAFKRKKKEISQTSLRCLGSDTESPNGCSQHGFRVL